MNNNFQIFVTNTEAKLRSHLKNGEVQEFAHKLTKLYPQANRFFTDETESTLEKNEIPKLLSKMKRFSLQMMEQYKDYDVQADKIVLNKKDGTTEEHPLLDVGLLLKSVLKLKDTEFGYFLIVSFFIQPLNYDFIQLFSVYLSKS